MRVLIFLLDKIVKLWHFNESISPSIQVGKWYYIDNSLCHALAQFWGNFGTLIYLRAWDLKSGRSIDEMPSKGPSPFGTMPEWDHHHHQWSEKTTAQYKTIQSIKTRQNSHMHYVINSRRYLACSGLYNATVPGYRATARRLPHFKRLPNDYCIQSHGTHNREV
jgi:hypothetical protein